MSASDEAARDLSFLKNVSFDVDVVASVADGGKLGFIEDFAVGQYFDAIVIVNLRVGQRREYALKLFRVERDRRRCAYFVAQSRLEQREKKHQR